MLIIGGVILLVLLVGGLLYYLHARNYASTDDAYTDGHVHEISARVPGTVQELKVSDNQRVKAGEVLLTLDPRDFTLAADKARALKEEAEAKVTQARADGERSAADLQKTEHDYARVSALFKTKAVSQTDMDAATASLQNAKAAGAAAGAALAVAQAAVGDAQAAVADGELQLSYTTIRAPVDGVVGKRSVETGQRVQPAQALLAVVEPQVWVVANYKETDLARIRVGQQVQVQVDAVPDHVFKAHVDSVQPGTGSSFALLPPDNATGNFTKIVQRVPVKIVFDSFDGFEDRLVPGMSVVPKVDLRSN